MLYRVCTKLIVMTALFLSFPFAALAQDAELIRVGDVPITVYEVSRELQRLLPLNSTYHGGVKAEKVKELREKAISQLIEQAYLTQYGYAEKLAVTSAEIDEMIKPIKKRFKSNDDFEAALGAEGLAAFRAAVSRKLMAEKAYKFAVLDKVTVDEGAIKAYYEKNKGKYKRPRQLRASSILLKILPEMTDEEKASKKALAESLYKKAAAGEDFHDLAYYNSEHKTAMVGGDLGYFHLGQMDEELEPIVVNLKVGEISKPIRTFYGYVIVKLVEDNPEKQLSYEDVKGKLISSDKKAQEERLKDDLMKQLKKKFKLVRSSNS